MWLSAFGTTLCMGQKIRAKRLLPLSIGLKEDASPIKQKSNGVNVFSGSISSSQVNETQQDNNPPILNVSTIPNPNITHLQMDVHLS